MAAAPYSHDLNRDNSRSLKNKTFSCGARCGVRGKSKAANSEQWETKEEDGDLRTET